MARLFVAATFKHATSSHRAIGARPERAAALNSILRPLAPVLKQPFCSFRTSYAQQISRTSDRKVYRVPSGEAQPNLVPASVLARRADLNAMSNRPLYWMALTLEM